MSLPDDSVARASVDYTYVESRGTHGHDAVGVCDAFVAALREIWIGSDGSGLIRDSTGPVSFFTDAGQASWEPQAVPSLPTGPSLDLFAPGC